MVEAQLSSQHKHNGTPALPRGTTQVPTPLSSIPYLALSTMEVQRHRHKALTRRRVVERNTRLRWI